MAAIFDPERERPAELRRWQAVFERDGNKAAAWRCYKLARAWGLPVPAAVLAEFDRIANALDSAVEQTRAYQAGRREEGAPPGLGRDHVGRVVTEAGRGAADPAAALLAWERDFAVETAVAMLRQSGASERQAVERVAAGTSGIARGLVFTDVGVGFGPLTTPALSPDAVRRSVRRVRELAANMSESTHLNDTTP